MMTAGNVTSQRFNEFVELMANGGHEEPKPRLVDVDAFQGHLPGLPSQTYHQFMAGVAVLQAAFDGFITDFRVGVEAVDMHVIAVSGVMELTHVGTYTDWQDVALQPTGDKVRLGVTIIVSLNAGYQVIGCRILFDRVELLEQLREARSAGA